MIRPAAPEQPTGPLTTTEAPPRPQAGIPAPPRRNPRLVILGTAMVVAVIHALVIGRYYAVGSFDDDAGYILGARAIAGGQGLSGHVASGALVAGAYPPGFPGLLAPVEWAFPHGFVPFQALSLVCYAALFPLTWCWMGRRHLGTGVRAATLGLLALSPVAATFGVMVMAEMPFLVVLLLVLLALERWEAEPRVWTWSAAGVLVGAASLVWLKEAAAGMIAGLALWLVLRRMWGKGAAVAAAVALSLVPVAVARSAAGVAITGSRYSQELGNYYHGGLPDRLVHVVPAALHQYLSVALPATVLPRGVPLPQTGWGAHLLRDLAWQVTALTVLGAVVWARRHRDATVVVVPVYAAETLLWPFINERRVILVLPVILAWYALGAQTAGAALLRAVRRSWRRRPAARVRTVQVSLGVLAAVVVVAPLVAQSSRDYLYGDFQHSPRPQGSRYMAMLAATPQGTVVETDYLSTTALFSGHRTADTAFLDNDPLATPLVCGTAAFDLQALTADGAGYLLTGSLNKPLVVDNPCLLDAATTEPWAVRLVRTERDGASVFELIGPGTVHPDLVDHVAAATVTGSGPLGTFDLASQGFGDNPGRAPWTLAASTAGTGTLTWDWGSPLPVAQVSVGGARSLDGPTGAVQVALRLPDGTWRTVASAPAGVGELRGAAPFVLARLASGTAATALRVTVHGSGRLTGVDVHALGPRALGAGGAATGDVGP